jgi:uncharacterized protein with HEPN domain
MRGKSGDKVRLQHILDAILEIEDYMQNMSAARHLSDIGNEWLLVLRL